MIEPLYSTSVWQKELSEMLLLLDQKNLIELIIDYERRDLKRLQQIEELGIEIEDLLDECSSYEEEADDEQDDSQEENRSDENEKAALQLISCCDLIMKLNEGALPLSGIAEELKPIEPSVVDFITASSSQLKRSSHAISSFLQGLQITMQKVSRILLENDLKTISPNHGDPFSPHLHRAVGYEQGQASGSIARLVRCGYQKKGKVLRFADVTIYS